MASLFELSIIDDVARGRTWAAPLFMAADGIFGVDADMVPAGSLAQDAARFAVMKPATHPSPLSG